MQATAALSGRWAGAAARLNATAGGAAHFARDAGVARHDQVKLGLWPCTRQAAEERGIPAAAASHVEAHDEIAGFRRDGDDLG